VLSSQINGPTHSLTVSNQYLSSPVSGTCPSTQNRTIILSLPSASTVREDEIRRLRRMRLEEGAPWKLNGGRSKD